MSTPQGCCVTRAVVANERERSYRAAYLVSPTYPTRVLNCGDGIAVAEVGPVCVVIWRGAVTRERFNTQRTALAAVVGRHPGKAGFLCVIEPTAVAPDDELRRASAAMIASHRGQLLCLATVIEANGFKAAVVRSVAAGIALIASNHEVPLQYFPNVDPAAAWMSKHVAINPPELVASVESIRSRLTAEHKLG
jgi:hypothetical protein